MNLKKFGIIFLLILSLLPINKIEAQTSKAGFIPGDIWYSKDPFAEGDKIQIYAFIFNPDEKELSGAVVFFDNTTYLGKKSFTLKSKTAQDVYINWTVSAGDHNIFAKIEDAQFLVAEGKYEQVYLAENETEKSPRTVPKTIISKTTIDTNNNIIKSTNTGFLPIASIEKTIEEKTPDFIAKPIVSIVNELEKIRENINTTSDTKKEAVKKEIKTIEDIKAKLDSKTNTKTTSNTTQNPLLKPFKYIELFFLSIFSFILNNKVVFYGILISIIFFALRFIWKKIF